MIIQRNADATPGLDKAFCKFHVFIRGGLASTRVIMGYDNRNGPQPNRVTEYFTRMNQHTIRSATQNVGRFAKEMSLRVKIKHEEMLLRIIDHDRTQLTNSSFGRFNRPDVRPMRSPYSPSD